MILYTWMFKLISCLFWIVWFQQQSRDRSRKWHFYSFWKIHKNIHGMLWNEIIPLSSLWVVWIIVHFASGLSIWFDWCQSFDLHFQNMAPYFDMIQPYFFHFLNTDKFFLYFRAMQYSRNSTCINHFFFWYFFIGQIWVTW